MATFCLSPTKQISAYYNRGLTWYLLKNYKAAIEDFDQVIRAVSVQPAAYFPAAYYSRGCCYMILGNKQAAVKDFQKAANLYQQQGQTQMYQNALNHLRQLQN